MPNMLDIHSCSKVQYENELLKKKLKKLKQENKELHEQIGEMKDVWHQQQMGLLGKRSIEVQTDPPKSWFSGIHSQPKKKEVAQETQQLNKLMIMNSNLMKRYEKELKTNMQHMETIATLNLQVNELQQKLKEAQMEISHIKFEKKSLEDRQIQGTSKQQRDTSDSSLSKRNTDHGDVKKELRKLRKERDRLAADKQKLKEELQALDHGFFEEIEDIKFALQQSARLNKAYEMSLRKLCKQFGVPYPNPEADLVNFDRRIKLANV